MSLSDASTQGTASTSMSLTLDSTEQTEGYVVAVAFDGSLCAVTDIATGSATDSAGAELFISEIFDDDLNAIFQNKPWRSLSVCRFRRS